MYAVFDSKTHGASFDIDHAFHFSKSYREVSKAARAFSL